MVGVGGQPAIWLDHTPGLERHVWFPVGLVQANFGQSTVSGEVDPTMSLLCFL